MYHMVGNFKDAVWIYEVDFNLLTIVQGTYGRGIMINQQINGPFRFFSNQLSICSDLDSGCKTVRWHLTLIGYSAGSGWAN